MKIDAYKSIRYFAVVMMVLTALLVADTLFVAMYRQKYYLLPGMSFEVFDVIILLIILKTVKSNKRPGIVLKIIWPSILILGVIESYYYIDALMFYSRYGLPFQPNPYYWIYPLINTLLKFVYALIIRYLVVKKTIAQ